MNTVDQSFEFAGKLCIDRGFKPDITRRGITHDVLELMEKLGMISVGAPVYGLPPKRYALWYGTKPNTYSEIPVVMVASTARVPDITAAWTYGVVEAESDFLCPSSETFERYSTFAIDDADGPENAIARSLLLLEGLNAAPPNIQNLAR